LNDKDQDIVELYEQKLLSKLRSLLPIWVLRVEKPDEKTEIELFSRNTTRWKINFEEICKQCGSVPDEFYQGIGELVRLNRKNPSVETIWYEAARFIAKRDNIIALRLYTHYIYQDLNSDNFDNRKLNKTVQKDLFHDVAQVVDFEAIIANLIIDKDLEKALDAVSHIYQPKHRKIILNRDTINQVSEKHSGTVELLNKYLDDDATEFDTQPTKREEIVIKINIPEPATPTKVYSDTLTFTALQEEALENFRKANFTIPVADLEIFAKIKGVFKNQLVDRINELCYDLLDDILIEQEDDNYIINEDYYQAILNK
jgi:hypothetical protein